jgi:hypothetical protein
MHAGELYPVANFLKRKEIAVPTWGYQTQVP